MRPPQSPPTRQLWAVWTLDTGMWETALHRCRVAQAVRAAVAVALPAALPHRVVGPPPRWCRQARAAATSRVPPPPMLPPRSQPRSRWRCTHPFMVLTAVTSTDGGETVLVPEDTTQAMTPNANLRSELCPLPSRRQQAFTATAPEQTATIGRIPLRGSFCARAVGSIQNDAQC